mgnify:CR=1 FL=1
MNPLILGPLLEFGKDVIGRFIPDPDKAREAEATFLKMAMDGELTQTIKQLEINAAEAQNPSIWVSGWRPFYGWGGGVGFLYATLGQPFLAWYSALKGYPPPPVIQSDILWTVITGLLGIGGMRTFEKVRSVSK